MERWPVKRSLTTAGITADDARASMPRAHAMLDHWVGVTLAKAEGAIAHAASQGDSSCTVDLEVASETYQAGVIRLVCFELLSRGFAVAPASGPDTFHVAWL